MPACVAGAVRAAGVMVIGKAGKQVDPKELNNVEEEFTESELKFVHSLFDTILDAPRTELLESVLRKVVDHPVPEGLKPSFAEVAKFSLITGYTCMHGQALSGARAITNMLASYEREKALASLAHK